jgi:hypothetical protein
LAKGKVDPHVSTERIEGEGPPSSLPMEEKRARPRGRPALPAEKGKRYAIGIRTTKALKDALLSASRASGRSLAQEIEFRLERSVEGQNLEQIVMEVINRQAREAAAALVRARSRLEKVAAKLVETGNERDTPPGTRRRRQRRRDGQPKADD